MNAVETFTRKAATVALGVVLVVCLGGAIALAWNGTDAPDLLQIVGGAAVGALAALVTGTKQPQ